MALPDGQRRRADRSARGLLCAGLFWLRAGLFRLRALRVILA
jgi:hypothetical protein